MYLSFLKIVIIFTFNTCHDYNILYLDSQTFKGNIDQNTIVKHNLASPFVARWVRFHPTDWHNHVSMRVEIYGCQGMLKK